MLKDIQYPDSGEYRTGSKNEPYQFYLEALLNSKSIDLLLGYFSSSAINILSEGFAYFLYNGGKVKMIINHILNEKDYNLLQEVDAGNVSDYASYLENFELLNITLDEYGQHFFKCLAWLIQTKRIEIVVVKPLMGNGIAHYKSGIFNDLENKVKFKASCNFTAFGLLENLEELEVKLSWDGLKEQKAIDEYQEYFNEIFDKKVSFLKYVKNSDIIINEIRERFGNYSIKYLIDESKKLRQKKKRFLTENCKEIITKIENEIDNDVTQPKFPYDSGPRNYQLLAYNNETFKLQSKTTTSS